MILADRYLRLIALMVILLNVVNTIGEFLLGKLVVAQASHAIADGTAAGQATAMLRPEAIAIIDSEGADLCGTVETVSFIGDRQRLTITGAADRPIVVEAPNSLAVEAGQRVGLGIEPRTVRLLPEDRR